MTNDLLQIKLKQRLNKLSSNDYDNIECWQIIEAFNKASTRMVPVDNFMVIIFTKKEMSLVKEELMICKYY